MGDLGALSSKDSLKYPIPPLVTRDLDALGLDVKPSASKINRRMSTPSFGASAPELTLFKRELDANGGDRARAQTSPSPDPSSTPAGARSRRRSCELEARGNAL